MTAYELLTRIANGTAPKRIRIIDIDRDFMLGEDGHYYGGQKNMMNLNQILGSNLSIDEILTKNCIQEVQGLTSAEYNLLADIRILYGFQMSEATVIKKTSDNDFSYLVINDGDNYCEIQIYPRLMFAILVPFKEYNLADLLNPDFH